ncbi:hypothetical protein B7486_16555 [cyanobacterium TDX16]|nr:hypothetical protein B7486_16555 [cyanobacterium TDX16]
MSVGRVCGVHRFDAGDFAMNDPVHTIIAKLNGVRSTGSNVWQALCPAHDDRNPSLTITRGADGTCLLKCHAGCTAESIVSAVGMKMADLFPIKPGQPKSKPAQGNGRIFATANEAVTELDRLSGPHSHLHTYQTVEGNPVGCIVRHDGPNGKLIRQVSKNGVGWLLKAMPKPRPLYRLPEISRAELVCIVEGEKCVDALTAIGIISTTSAGGANAAAHSDWSPLAGKAVCIMPDNDGPGEGYAEDVIAELSKLNPAPRIRINRLPNLQQGEDVFDYVALRRKQGKTEDEIRAEIEALNEKAEAVEPESTARRAPQWKPFPTETLPQVIRDYVETTARAMGCDASFAALPLLVILAGCVGGKRRLLVKRGWTEPCILWAACVGDSGTLKTPALKAAATIIREAQAEKLKEYRAAVEAHENEVLQYEADLLDWKRRASRGPAGDPPKKPIPPLCVRYIVSDITIEALSPILLENPGGVILIRDELAGWIGGMNAYKGGRGGDEAHWLSMHTGDALTVDRKSGIPKTIYVPSANVGIIGGIQPQTLDRVMGVENRENGLLARILLAYPPKRQRKWSEAEVHQSVIDRVTVIVGRLLTLKHDIDDKGNLRARLVRWTPSGKTAWLEFFTSHAEQGAALTGHLASAWSKLEGYCARLALLFHLVRVATGDGVEDAEAVDAASVRAAAALVAWFGHETVRLYGLFEESDEEQADRLLIEWIESRGGEVTARELAASGPRSMRGKVSEARERLDRLVKAGHGQWSFTNQTGKGRPSERFTLISGGNENQSEGPNFGETGNDIAAHDSASGNFVSVSSVSKSLNNASIPTGHLKDLSISSNSNETPDSRDTGNTRGGQVDTVETETKIAATIAPSAISHPQEPESGGNEGSFASTETEPDDDLRDALAILGKGGVA